MPQSPLWLLAPDAFKGTLDACEVAQGLLEGIRSVRADLVIRSLPMADGGEGTQAVLQTALGGTLQDVQVTSTRPGGASRSVPWLLLPSGVAVVELATCAGLPLLKPLERNPLETSSHPLGQLIQAVFDQGVASLVIGLGGSATVGGGLGVLQALGAVLTHAGRRLDRPCTGADLLELDAIDLEPLQARVGNLDLHLAVDVSNPLTGASGAAQVFAPQKGADVDAVERLEAGLQHVSNLLGDAGRQPGDGAAGGAGWGLRLGLGAQVHPGARLVADLIGLPEACREASVVVTGEGCYDDQTEFGKVPSAVAALAHAGGASSALVAGRIDRSPDALAADAFSAHIALDGLSADPAVGHVERLHRAGKRLVGLLAPPG